VSISGYEKVVITGIEKNLMTLLQWSAAVEVANPPIRKNRLAEWKSTFSAKFLVEFLMEFLDGCQFQFIHRFQFTLPVT
jgi:hypothetical protein